MLFFRNEELKKTKESFETILRYCHTVFLHRNRKTTNWMWDDSFVTIQYTGITDWTYDLCKRKDKARSMVLLEWQFWNIKEKTGCCHCVILPVMAYLFIYLFNFYIPSVHMRLNIKPDRYRISHYTCKIIVV
jgi:hypothetical protein